MNQNLLSLILREIDKLNEKSLVEEIPLSTYEVQQLERLVKTYEMGKKLVIAEIKEKASDAEKMTTEQLLSDLMEFDQHADQ